MDIVIRTGFESILHNITFQPCTVLKGRKLVESGHVLQVEENRRDGHSYMIKCIVVRQTSVSLEPYKVQLHKNELRIISKASCSCVYNQSSKCKHIAALIYYINHEKSLTKTSHEQQWGKPTARQLVQAKYSKGRYFCDMFPPNCNQDINYSNVNLQIIESDICNLSNQSALKMSVIEGKKDENECDIKNLMQWMLNKVENNLLKEDCKECVNNFFIFQEEYVCYSKQYKLTSHLFKFYCEKIIVSANRIVELCCNTVQQSQCNEWYLIRKQRISASKDAHNIKVRRTKSIDKLITEMLEPKSTQIGAMKYGNQNEKHARELYQKINNCDVKQVGVLLNHKQPWLCGSIDGVIVDDGCITKIVEFKCPITCEKIPVIDKENNKSNVSYLKLENNEIVLNSNYIYYTQVQMQMYISGMSVCDLFVYSKVPNGSCTVQVLRSEKFIKTVILQCEEFYFNHYLPATYAKVSTVPKEKRVEEEKLRDFTGKDISDIRP